MRIDYVFLRASAIFVSGTSGITSILNYRSKSPIMATFYPPCFALPKNVQINVQ